MNTSKRPNIKKAFAVWVTGLPASGKSTVTASLVEMLARRGVDVAVLESDVWRKILTPHASYSDEDRNVFYRALASIGKLLVDHRVSVIFDATANLRAYRDRAREMIPCFIEVFVDSPLEFCCQRDPKGIYRRGHTNNAAHVPGLQSDYEPPLNPQVVVQGQDQPYESAMRICKELERLGYIPGTRQADQSVPRRGEGQENRAP